METEPTNPDRPLFQRPHVIALLAATFLLIAAPFGLLIEFGADPEILRPIQWTYWSTLGLGHFYITFVLYLQARNRRYFTSSSENFMIYFIIPGAFFIYTGLSRTFEFWGNTKALGVAAGIATIVRCLDFNHFAGQTFGVLQIVKSHSRAVFRTSQRHLERLFLLSAGVLQVETQFISGGRIDLSNTLVLLTASLAFVFFAGVSIRFLGALARQGSNRGIWIPFGYFLAQASCTIGAAIDIRLYGPALAIHYVEYHLLITQRMMHAELDRNRWSDRALLLFLKKPGFLAAAAMVFSVFMYTIFTRKAGMGPIFDQLPTTLQFTYNMSNGIFFMHYFVESFVWKFKNPFYREEMRFLAPKNVKIDHLKSAA